MDVGVLVQYTLALSPQELRILSRALRCTLKEEDKAEALALQEKILRERAKYIKHLAEEADKAVRNLDAKDGP